MAEEGEGDEHKKGLYFGTIIELGFWYKGTVLKFKAMEEMEAFFLRMILEGYLSCHRFCLKFLKKVRQFFGASI